jgi:outer membrane protein OmpA-like peptidoglycan-associated protein
MYIAGTFGTRLRRGGEFGGVKTDHEFTFGLGAGIPVYRDLVSVHVEFFGATMYENFFGRESTPVEILIGGKYRFIPSMQAGLSAGMGLNRGVGSPDYRLVALIGWANPIKEPPPFVPEPAPPVLDSDGDGLLDPDDQCPDDPEDKDSFEDENGCPDPDNDQDGILDKDDACVNEPEDIDQFEDENGCPDPDNDQDGILDVDDQCPNEAGIAENNGCPDPDRDNDTVPDRIDNCPDEPGPPENHGCAEKQLVVLTESKIEILDKVYFKTGKATIATQSFALLENVASVLLAHPEIPMVRVEGHTDDVGRDKKNLKLSRRRAESVVKFLVDAGVESERLQPIGYGETRPVQPNTTKEGRAANRRVEFNLGAAK